MLEFTTPVGRIVWGHPAKSQTKKHQDGPNKGQPVLKDGQPVQVWSFGVAYDKATFQQQIWPYLEQEARSGYPSGVPQRFSWKYKDGDGVDGQGKPYNTREGYAGCFILTISSELQAVPVFKLNGGKYDQLLPEQIKCGDYVAVGLSVKVNVPPANSTNTPSLYINPQAVELIGYGSEIVSQGSVDPSALFKGAQHALPPGASAIPQQAPNAPGMPGMGAAMRPVDPSHIHMAGTPQEQWFINGAWTPAPVATQLPPPAPDFVHAATAMTPAAPMPMPGAMPPR